MITCGQVQQITVLVSGGWVSSDQRFKSLVTWEAEGNRGGIALSCSCYACVEILCHIAVTCKYKLLRLVFGVCSLCCKRLLCVSTQCWYTKHSATRARKNLCQKQDNLWHRCKITLLQNSMTHFKWRLISFIKKHQTAKRTSSSFGRHEQKSSCVSKWQNVAKTMQINAQQSMTKQT